MSHQADRRVTRRGVLAGAAAGVAAAAVPSLPALAAQQWIVRDGVGLAAVVVGPAVDSQTSFAASLLVEYVEKATGARLPIVADQGSQFGIFLGIVGPGVEISEQELAALDHDGFILRSGTNCVTIIGGGGSSWGTRFGVSEFLERFLGVAWLLPGPDGEYVPRTDSVHIPGNVSVSQTPVMKSRVLAPVTGYRGPVWNSADSRIRWANANRVRYRIEFTHYLHHIIPPEKYGNPNRPELYRPDFFPLRNGVHFIPAPGAWTGWQPRFTAEGIVSAAADTIIDHFDANPDLESVSLGVQDASGYSEDELDPNRLNSINLPDMSDIYYAWVRDVVNEVLGRRPDLGSKWFGAIAYRSVYDPPSFALPPQVIVFIARERYGWVDDTFRAEDTAQLEKWQQVVDQVGWYDYAYGSIYGVPRLFTNQMVDYIRYGAEHGVTANYVELTPGWGEGPKGWAYAKLMWGDSRSANALTDFWVRRAVGDRAAPWLAKYYKLWERIWAERVPDTGWFTVGWSEPYFRFNNAAYLNVFTPDDIAEARTYLERALDAAPEGPMRRRATALMRYFEYHEATALSYPRDGEAVPADATTAVALIEDNIQRAAIAAKRPALAQQLYADPDLKPSTANLFAGGLNWPGWSPYTFWNLVDYVRLREPSGGRVTDRLVAMRDSASLNRSAEFARLLLAIAAGSTSSFIVDPSFQTAGDPAPWFLWIDGPGAMTHTDGVTWTGNGSLKVHGIQDQGGPFQSVPITPGMVAGRVRYTVPAGSATRGVVNLSCNLQSATGATVGTWNSIAYRNARESAGTWSTLDLLLDIPDRFNNTPIRKLQLGFFVSDFGPDDTIYIDDFQLHR